MIDYRNLFEVKTGGLPMDTGNYTQRHERIPDQHAMQIRLGPRFALKPERRIEDQAIFACYIGLDNKRCIRIGECETVMALHTEECGYMSTTT